MIRRPPRSTLSSSSAASDVYKRQHAGRFRMTEYIGIDVSKQSLELWDGTHEEEVPNERGLKTLKKLLKKRYGGEWNETVRFIYEPTGPYSNYLRAFAAEHEVQVYEVNPKK